MGGDSREREVSLLSGRAVARALAGRGHDVRACDVRPGEVTADLVRGLDVAFVALHGRWGEDGALQEELEALGACYTGSGPEASRLAMDKVAAKRRFAEAGVPTPAFRVVPPGDGRALDEALAALGPDLVTKPVADGSSLGISMCDSAESLRRGAEAVWRDGRPVLVERRVLGREFTVGFLGRTALPLIEIRVPGGWYDYRNKYQSDRTEYVFDHGLPREVERRIAEAALGAFDALGCRDLARVDLMLSPDGRPLVLEVNTIPGFTDHSLVPKAAARAGLSFGQLCERIVDLARVRAGSQPAGRPA
jgi:D-alanine-D-alanine ligase